MMLAISEYVHDYSGCGDKDLFLGRSESNFFSPPPLCRSCSPAEPIAADSDQWVGKRHMFIKGPSSNGSAKSKMTLSAKDIHKSCHKLSNRIICFDLSHFDKTDNGARSTS